METILYGDGKCYRDITIEETGVLFAVLSTVKGPSANDEACALLSGPNTILPCLNPSYNLLNDRKMSFFPLIPLCVLCQLN